MRRQGRGFPRAVSSIVSSHHPASRVRVSLTLIDNWKRCIVFSLCSSVRSTLLLPRGGNGINILHLLTAKLCPLRIDGILLSVSLLSSLTFFTAILSRNSPIGYSMMAFNTVALKKVREERRDT